MFKFKYFILDFMLYSSCFYFLSPGNIAQHFTVEREQLLCCSCVVMVVVVVLQEWSDANMRWNASEYGNVQDVRIPPKVIWTPDLLMYNR